MDVALRKIDEYYSQRTSFCSFHSKTFFEVISLYVFRNFLIDVFFSSAEEFASKIARRVCLISLKSDKYLPICRLKTEAYRTDSSLKFYRK